jgi:hypothetical protein
MKKVVVAIVFLWGVVPCTARIITVDGNAPADFNNIQAAINAATIGDIIEVKPGTYTGQGNRDIDFLGKSITVRSTNPADPNVAASTIINCQGSITEPHRGFRFHNGETSSSVLSGLTIINGYGPNEDVGYGAQSYGGAIYCYGCGPTIEFCRIETSQAKYGGAIYCHVSSTTIKNCTISGNSVTGTGGGIGCRAGTSTVSNCIIKNNSGPYGCGLEFIDETATAKGCIITNNSVNYRGGGVRVVGGSATFINCTIADNSAGLYGGGLYFQSASGTVINCVLWNNNAPNGSQIYPTGMTVTYSDIKSGYSGQGNISVDPCFVNSSASNYHLMQNSPCIDTGDPCYTGNPGDKDIDGQPRIINGRVDMGADEFVSANAAVLAISPDEMSFYALHYGPAPNGQILTIWNTGGGTLNWQISEECPWLEAIPSAGSCTTEIDESEITIDSTGLEPGSYECELTVYDNNALNSPQMVEVVLHVTEIPPSEYWRDYIEFPNDPFKSEEISENDPGWVKFTMIVAPPYNPDSVYFQDSVEYPFHYDFATEFLTPFIGMSRDEYNLISLYKQGQQAALGAVIMPADQQIKEYGIQFIRYDAYTKEEVANMFNAVKAGIIAGPNVQAFYFPSYEQLASAEANRTWFEAQGIPISSTVRWATGNACYSAGWALGTLKYFDGNEIQSAYEAGTLLPGDILLTDGVPAEVPFVAGILTLAPSTPSSHVAILAQTFGVPFGHLALAADANHAQQLVGRLVMVCVGEQGGVDNIAIKDMTGLLTEGEKNQILALKIPEELNITAMEPYGAYSANTNGLEPNDIRYFGGKAANFGILRRAIPDNCPNAVALSFQLWNEFLSQTLGSGKTLREEINSRLSAYTYPPSNLPALYANLQYIREELFTNNSATTFTQQQMDAIISILQDPNYGFDPNRNIRFRSSTNVEDTNRFSGAGLYDSFSGCLADDLDGDTKGPCICNPVESKERGVFRAIRKVFASFYNDNAYLERLRHRVDENDVGMGILVHHSSPDQFELANGVATLEKRQGDPNRYIKLVTQKGAVSVANPEDGSIPEEVTVVYKSESDIELTLVRSSNLVILGETVLDWPADYNGFASLLAAASEEFETELGKTDYLLDFEYKKLLPGGSLPKGGLAIKQIREIPKSEQGVSVTTPFLVNEAVWYFTFQGESDVFANHCLKSRWTLGTKSMWLTPENLANSFYGNVSLEYQADGQIRTITSQIPLLPQASHGFGGTTTTDGWLMQHLSNPRSYSLITENIKTQVGPTESPIVTLSDFGWPLQPNISSLEVQANYARPLWPGGPTSGATLICPELGNYLFQQRSCTISGISITTTFYYAYWESMILTYPLSHFIETTITGLTTQPIVLHGYYSQTFAASHHNYPDYFLFEPRLEPGISQSILDELEAQNIQLIYYNDDYYNPSISTLSYDEIPFLAADIDKDNNVDFLDFAVFGSQWLDSVCGQCEGADLTDDGRVDIDDLHKLAEEWLKEL